MPECTEKDLKIARKRADLTQWAVANACAVSESVLQRWESGETLPSPDDVDAFAIACGDRTLWHRWMLSHYDSYRKYYTDYVPVNNVLASLTKLRFKMADVAALQEKMERDGVDGVIDDQATLAQYLKEAKEMQAALTEAIGHLAQNGSQAHE